MDALAAESFAWEVEKLNHNVLSERNGGPKGVQFLYRSSKRETDMEEDEISDEFLIEAIAGGAMWALERLCHRYRGRFYALAFRMTTDKMVAEELVQDTFLALWRNATSYDPQAGPVRGRLFSIIYHHTIDYLRSLRRRSSLHVCKRLLARPLSRPRCAWFLWLARRCSPPP